MVCTTKSEDKARYVSNVLLFSQLSLCLHKKDFEEKDRNNLLKDAIGCLESIKRGYEFVSAGKKDGLNVNDFKNYSDFFNFMYCNPYNPPAIIPIQKFSEVIQERISDLEALSRKNYFSDKVIQENAQFFSDIARGYKSLILSIHSLD